MEACCAVERELEKLLGRYKTLCENSSKLNDLIKHVESIKNGLCEGKLKIPQLITYIIEHVKNCYV